MKILILADPFIPIPPEQYGGIERIIDFLTRRLSQMGDQVHLMAHPDSTCPVDCHEWPSFGDYASMDDKANRRAVGATIRRLKPDIIHSFARLQYLLPVLPSRIPKIMTFQREITARTVRLAGMLSLRSLHFTAIAQHMIDDRIPHRKRWHVIFNGVEMATYKAQAQVKEDAPLLFLGRIEPIKGTHIACQVAEQSGKKLIIAGHVSKGYERYFDEEVKPYIGKGVATWVGPVNDQQKNKLYGQSLAFLMPIQWEEPFGIVMAEALACGTPIIGFSRGSVPEIVRHGENGFIADSVSQMVDAVNQSQTISRKYCRQDAESRFSAASISQQYRNLYASLL